MSQLTSQYIPSDTDKQLRYNLAKFVEFNRDDDQLVLKARREIAIARNALEEANNVYITIVELLKSSLIGLGVSPANISNVLINIKQIEDKSYNLISMCEKVSKVLFTATQIEAILASKMGGLQVYSIVAQVPVLLRTTILSITNNDALANQCASALEEQLQQQLTVLEGTSTPSVQPIIEEQVRAMLESVPVLPDE